MPFDRRHQTRSLASELCVCVGRLNREEGEGAWCPQGELEPSDSQYLQVRICSALKTENMFGHVAPLVCWSPGGPGGCFPVSVFRLENTDGLGFFHILK